MSSTNKTTYYELPQFVDNDIFNPLVDDNDAYSKIDTALHNIADAEADDASEIVGIKSRLDSAEGDIDALEAQNGNNVLTTTAQTLSGAINEVNAEADALAGRVTNVEDDINNASTGLKVKVTALETQNGNAPLNTTAQTLSGAVNELDAEYDTLNKLTKVVTPQMFGAVGNGVTDDTDAFTALTAYLDDLIHARNLNDYRPSGYMGGITLHIPAGIYILNKTFVVPAFINVVGDGIDNTVLKFDNTCEYGISLDGKPYNGLKEYSGNISDVAIVMGGAGIGLSNAQLSTSSTNNNCISNSNFTNICVTNADIGILIQGVWNTIFDHITCQTCSFGFIIDMNAFQGGSNNNTIMNYVGSSFTNCGLWCDTKGLYTENVNVEAVGDAWQGNYSAETFTINNKEYSVEYPCAVYITGSTIAEFNSPWFERLTTTSGDVNTYAFLMEHLDIEANGNPLTHIDIISPHFNNDVFRPILCDGASRLYVSHVVRKFADYPLAEILNGGGHGAYIFDDLAEFQANTIVANPVLPYNSIIFENVRGQGNTGLYNSYYNTKSKGDNTVWSEYYRNPSNPDYDCKKRQVFSTPDKTIVHYINDAINMREYYDGTGIGLPQNVGTVSVASGATSVVIPTISKKDNYCIVLIAEDAVASRTLKEGYYISATIWNSITVTFNQAFSADATLHYFVMTS